jgi:protein-disulfide isomerase
MSPPRLRLIPSSSHMSSEHDKQQSVAGMTGTPRTMFFLGLASGVGGMALVALVFLLSLLMGGKGLSGLKMEGTGTNVVANAPVAPTDPSAAQPPAGPVKPVDEATDHILGKKDAKVTLIEYSDFECPFCLRHVDTLKALMAKYPNDVRLVYRHYPLSFHPEAQKAAEASECAGAQGKFWEMHDKIFDANEAGTMSVQAWKDAAKALGLNTSKFNTCLDNGEMANRVAQDLQEGATAGVGGTPATFVNGQMVEGAVPLATFEQAVQAAGASS